MSTRKKCLVVLSGGQDSTTCLAWAKQNFEEVHAVTFNYGQRHSLELEAARQVVAVLPVASHEIIDIPGILHGTSPLVNSSEQLELYESAEVLPGGLEKTFVPMRNLLFLVIAANRAACLGINTMVVGVCQEDFGGYPDCRQVFVDAAEEAIEKALNLNSTEEGRFAILAPLMNMSKRESVEFAMDLPFAMEALSYTHTCYAGEFPPCGHCHACLLRARGFGEAGIIDPIYERLAMEEMRRRS